MALPYIYSVMVYYMLLQKANKDLDIFDKGETPEFSGKAVVALATGGLCRLNSYPAASTLSLYSIPIYSQLLYVYITLIVFLGIEVYFFTHSIPSHLLIGTVSVSYVIFVQSSKNNTFEGRSLESYGSILLLLHFY